MLGLLKGLLTGSGGIQETAGAVGGLAKDIRTAITGKMSAEDQAKIDMMLGELQLKADELELKSEELDAQVVVGVQATMQAESKSEHWPQYSWRPFWGFVSGTAFLFVVMLCCFLAYKAIIKADAAALTMIPQLVMAFAGLFSIAGAILGVASWHRGKEKREAIVNIAG